MMFFLVYMQRGDINSFLIRQAGLNELTKEI